MTYNGRKNKVTVKEGLLTIFINDTGCPKEIPMPLFSI